MPSTAGRLGREAARQPFDYLFSIVNFQMLADDIVRLPRKGAVNFHDSLLPKYAGFHATSWALMNRETSHGVTWHLMSRLADAGHILKQRTVLVADRETAFTLNAKCYEAALESFAELVDDLAQGSCSPSRQSERARTYFSKYARPAAACCLRFDRSADEIEAFVRAMDFGPYPNPLGLPKLKIKNRYFIVSEARTLEASFESRPATIASIDDKALRVATNNGELEVSRILSLDGKPIAVRELVENFALHPGYVLEPFVPQAALRASAINDEICKHEEFWVERLKDVQPFRLPYSGRKGSPAGADRYGSVKASTPPGVISSLERRFPGANAGTCLVAACAAYFARIAAVSSFDIGYRDGWLRNELEELEGLFAPTCRCG